MNAYLTSFWQISRAFRCSKWAALCRGVYFPRPSMLTLVVLWFSKAFENMEKINRLYQAREPGIQKPLWGEQALKWASKPERFAALNSACTNLLHNVHKFTSTISTFPVRTAAWSAASSLWSLRFGFAWLWRRNFTVLTCPADIAQCKAVLP